MVYRAHQGPCDDSATPPPTNIATSSASSTWFVLLHILYNLFFYVPFSYIKSLEEKVEKMENLLRKYPLRFFDVMEKYQWTLANPSPGRIPEAIQTLPEDTPSMLPALVHSPSIEELDVEERDHALEFTRPP